jgi:tetratricopeptide (TPR) repeat protein
LLFIAGLTATAALAQTPSFGTSPLKAQLAARQQELLQVMLKRPDDLDTAFEYASISAQLGDYEAAISTFERMLVYAPGLPRVELELGVLYFRLGSFDAARYYFDAALKAPNVPPEVEEKVSVYLAAIDNREDPTKFAASVAFGVRYQSNANAGPGGRRVVLNGTPFLLSETSTGQSDVNGYIAGHFHGGYDLGTQGDLLEADLLVYGARYYDQVRLDTGIAELTIGPSFNMKRFNIDNTRAGIYGIFSGVRLDHANYSGALGLGTRFVSDFSPTTRLTGKAEYRQRWYNNSMAYPSVSDRNGYVLLVDLILHHQISGSVLLRSEAFGDFEEASRNWNQSWEAGFSFGGTYKFASPVESLPDPWSIDMEAGFAYRDFDSPDQLINATETEYDYEGWVRGVFSVPLRKEFKVNLTGELRRQFSNYDLSTYTNASGMLTVVKNF